MEFESQGQEFLEEKTSYWGFFDRVYCEGIEGEVNVDLAGPGVSSPPLGMLGSTSVKIQTDHITSRSSYHTCCRLV